MSRAAVTLPVVILLHVGVLYFVGGSSLGCTATSCRDCDACSDPCNSCNRSASVCNLATCPGAVPYNRQDPSCGVPLSTTTGGAASVSTLLVSGQPVVLTIDGNGDGPGPGDCTFTVTFSLPSLSFSYATLVPTQDSTTPLDTCSYKRTFPFFTGATTDSDFGSFDLTNLNPPSNQGASALSRLFDAPLLAEMLSQSSSGPPNGLPLEVNKLNFEESDGTARGVATFCRNGGPLVSLQVGGVPIQIQTSFFPNAQNPTHLRIPSLPFVKAGTTSLAFLDAYMPVTNHTITAALDSDPSKLLVNLDLDQIPPCADTPRTNAPATTFWGFITMLCSLLLAGWWRVSRRRRS